MSNDGQGDWTIGSNDTEEITNFSSATADDIANVKFTGKGGTLQFDVSLWTQPDISTDETYVIHTTGLDGNYIELLNLTQTQANSIYNQAIYSPELNKTIIYFSLSNGNTLTITANGDVYGLNGKNNSTIAHGNSTASITYGDETFSGDYYYTQVSNVLGGNSSSGYTLALCFLAGSLITVPHGQTPVEYLVAHDEIITYTDGIATPRRVTWAGKAHCTVRPHLPDDEAGYPVRILKDAIADGVPFKDMLITAEHCLFFDGKFVPARMLVNGRSIFFDKSITSYDYYHVETEDHSVIMADGMLTESYLDTGNRHTFSQKGNVISIGGSRNLTWDDAAVPLTVSRETIEPLFRQIEARAEKADVTPHTEARPLTDENNLHLVTETGTLIRPARQNNGRVMFMIPPDIQSVRIVSNTSRPCDVIGPFVDDRRTLGVLVGEITMFESNRTHTLTAHLHETDLSGWNNVEEGTMRWTAGNALIDLGHRAPGSLGLMAIEIKAAGPYRLEDTLSEKQVLRA